MSKTDNITSEHNSQDIISFFREYQRSILKTPSYGIFPPVICKDRYFMSVQADAYHYCYPNKDLDDFNYEDVEVRCSEDDTKELDFYVSDDRCTFKNVHVSLVNSIIESHGGIDHEKVREYIGNR